MHTQLASVCVFTRKTLHALHIHTQTLIGIFWYTEMVTHMLALHKDEIYFTSMDAILKQS